MQHQYWVTKKSVLRKLGGKEDECIVSSDAELDAKLELFKSINDSCAQLQRVIDLYQERLCYLAQEENVLGRYLRDCGKNEKNTSAGQIMSIAGKALAYTGHQRLTIRPSLVRLHHELETFRNRAITDTRVTISEMEKTRTEYRAALSWMKSVSSELDPDTGHGLEKFRKAQSYVKKTKTKFDRLTLACLQKVDLLAAARCNMFSHSLVPYQSAILNFSTKSSETLGTAAGKLDTIKPTDNTTIMELFSPFDTDKSKKTFFNSDYSDDPPKSKKKDEEESKDVNNEKSDTAEVADLLNADFLNPPPIEQPITAENANTKPSDELLDLNWTSNADFMSGDFMPSKLMQEGFFNTPIDPTQQNLNNFGQLLDKTGENNATNENKVSWLSLFAELDPLANPVLENNSTASDRA
ncbi:islet cell autoantigen 1 [Diabrotica virgifera virgifera]|uniref:AH domain-containing protein n=1 Tax=Diabrotica virgifera virgifera TaxID=50390 RepID=A0ABM5IKE3_DIAVI|nr:islet cell autoantigen 1 [Diabrotica virgifera virgifera]